MADEPAGEVVEHPIKFPADVVAFEAMNDGSVDGFLPGTVELVLLEVAVKGGNATGAIRSLRAQYPGERFPLPQTALGWVRGPLRNRYHEILSERLDNFQAQNLSALNERQISMNELEADLERQIRARMPELDAVSAARALQNVAYAKKVAIDGAATISRVEAASADSRSIAEIARALSNLGVGTITDAEVVEEPSPPSSP